MKEVFTIENILNRIFCIKNQGSLSWNFYYGIVYDYLLIQNFNQIYLSDP